MIVDKVLDALDLPDPDDRGGNPLRGSRLGRCARQSAYMMYPGRFTPEPLPARSKLVFRFGDLIHDLIREKFRAVVPGEWGMEEERFYFAVPLTVAETGECVRKIARGELFGTLKTESPRAGARPRGLVLDTASCVVHVPVHPDGVADLGPRYGLATVEIKSMATGSFRRALAGDVDYSYRVQMAVECEAAGLDSHMYVAVRKDTCHALEVVYSKRATTVEVRLTKASRAVQIIQRTLRAPEVTEALAGDVESGGAMWEAAEVQHPFEPNLLDDARRRVKAVIMAKPDALPDREYAPEFRCATCAGTGTQTLAKNGDRAPLKRGPKACVDCGATGQLEEAELPFQCSYAIPPETPILMDDLTWTSAGKLVAGDQVFGFDENPVGRYRRTKKSVIKATIPTPGPTLVLTTSRGVIRCSPEHPWLVLLDRSAGRGRRAGISWQNKIHWREASNIRPGMAISYLVPRETMDHDADDYLAGYIRGVVEGDGNIQIRRGGPSVRVAMTDGEALDRLAWALHAFGVPWRRSAFNPGSAGFPGRLPIERVSFGDASGAPMTARLLAWPIESEEAAAGYLAGVFDAEGSCDRWGSPRVSQRLDSPLLGRFVDAGHRLGFEFKTETWRRGRDGTMGSVRLYADPLTPALLRFFAVVQPAIRRKVKVWGRPIRNTWATVLSVERGPVEQLVSLQTSTRTFVADGFSSHNCPYVTTCWEGQYRLKVDERPHFIVRREAVSACA